MWWTGALGAAQGPLAAWVGVQGRFPMEDLLRVVASMWRGLRLAGRVLWPREQ